MCSAENEWEPKVETQCLPAREKEKEREGGKKVERKREGRGDK